MSGGGGIIYYLLTPLSPNKQKSPKQEENSNLSLTQTPTPDTLVSGCVFIKEQTEGCELPRMLPDNTEGKPAAPEGKSRVLH